MSPGAESAEPTEQADPADSPARPLRADARRNYNLLLAAAKDIFTERGADAPLDDIARRAGVGNATMYRHFPTRSELIVAVYADEVAELCARGERLAEAEPAGEALFHWLAAFIAHVSAKRDLALAIVEDRGQERTTLFGQWHTAMRSTATRLLDRAQQAHAVRADLTVVDLLTLANGLALTGAGPEQLARLLRLIREGTDAVAGQRNGSHRR